MACCPVCYCWRIAYIWGISSAHKHMAISKRQAIEDLESYNQMTPNLPTKS